MSENTEAVSSTEGFFVNLSLNGSSLSVDGLDGDDSESGGGASLTLGYGFTPRFSLFLTGSSANMNPDEGDSYYLSHGDLGVRYLFSNPMRKFVPFLELAATGRALTQEDVELDEGGGSTADLELSGAGFTAGGGIMYFFSPRWGLTTRLNWTSGEFSTIKFGNLSLDGLEVDATTVRIDVGITWYPGR